MRKHKISANRKVDYALKKGVLSRPNVCQRCGISSLKIYAHHSDYSKPLDVEWLCPLCHGDEHSKKKFTGEVLEKPADFWGDIDRSISIMVRETIRGHIISDVVRQLKDAGIERVSRSLLYKWSNPNAEQQPSLKQFLLLVKICENCQVIDSINEACGKVGVPDANFLQGVKIFTAEFERRERMGGK